MSLESGADWRLNAVLTLGLTVLGGLISDSVRGQAPALFSAARPSQAEVAAQAVRDDDAVLRRRLAPVEPSTLAGVRALVLERSHPVAVTLNLFDDTVLTGIVERTALTFSGGYSVSGRLADEPFGSMTLVVNGGAVTGSVRTVGGTYAIRSTGGGLHSISEVDESQAPSECGVAEWTIGRAAAADPKDRRPSAKAPFAVRSEVDAALTTVDVLLAYTPRALADEGGFDAIVNRMELMIAETNEAYAASGVVQRLDVAAVVALAYKSPETTDDENLAATLDVDAIYAKREEVGADLIVLIASWPGSPIAGVAPGVTTVSARSDHLALAVVSVHRFGSLTFAHEVGHMMGLMHDRRAECRNGSCTAATFPYSYGYVNQGAFAEDAPVEARWRTILGISPTCINRGFYCTRLPFFSNPDLYFDGEPMGVPGEEMTDGRDGPADAVRSLNGTREIVAGYREFDLGALAFAVDSYAASEGGADAQVTLELEAALARRIVVQLLVTAADGARAADHSNVPATIVFEPGETEKTFTVSAVDDAFDDDGESISIAIGEIAGGGGQGSSSTTTVTLTDNDMVAGAPTVNAVSLLSDAGSDAAYALGDAIEAGVTFTKSVVVTGAPQLQLTIGGEQRQADFSSAAGELLTFAYTVASGDLDSGGISIAEDSLNLNGGTVKDSSDQNAVLDHGAILTQADHRVDGVAPELEEATVRLIRLTLTYDETLEEAPPPTPSSFSVLADGSSLVVTAVEVDGSTVRLMLDPWVRQGETVSLDYNPSGNVVRDIAGNQADALSGQAVTNTSPLVVYDLDLDGLIEIANLEQLNAVRYDLDGDGEPTASGATDYLAAFPDAGSVLECGSDGCEGYELMSDLDFDTNENGQIDVGDDYWDGGSGWTPLGSGPTDAFNATFEGNGHTISNLFIDSDAAYVGLFGYAGDSSLIEAVGLVKADVSTTSEVAGGAGILVGVTTSGVGFCFAEGSLSGHEGAGGLVGKVLPGGTIYVGYAAASVSGWRYVGGLAGYASGTVTGSYAIGSVSGASSVGGLVGYGHLVHVNNSYAAVLVSGDSAVGGLMGSIYAGPSGDFYPRSSIARCYAAGFVSSAGMSGGLIGALAPGRAPSVQDSYWDADTSGRGTGTYGLSLTTEELQAANRGHSGFFYWAVGAWQFGPATAYPVLSFDLNRNGASSWREFGHQLRGGPALTKVFDQTGLELRWTAVNTSHWTSPPAVTYSVYRHDGYTAELLAADQTGLAYRVASWESGSDYTYQVVALVDGREAAWSSIVDSNASATGFPAVTGMPLQGGTLTASTTGIVDLNGMTGAAFTYQWYFSDAGVDVEIPGQTAPGLQIGPAETGKSVRVRVSFTDDAGYIESILSPVVQTAALLLTANPQEVVEASGTATVTVSTGGVTWATHQLISLGETPLESATEGEDYLIGSRTLTLQAGGHSVSTTVTALDDRIDEDGEIVGLVARLGGAEASQSVTIVDDDERGVVVSETSLSVDEGSSSGYSVVLTSEPTAQVVVEVELDRSGTGVSLDRTTLTFTENDWDLPQEIQVSAATDLDTEADAGVTVRHLASGGDYDSVAVADLRVRVVETDASSVSVDDERVGEGDGVVEFHVALSLVSNADVTVDYATSDGSGPDGAEAGSDYTASTGTITFVAGATTGQVIRVAILDDAADEAEAEAFRLTLSNAVGASLAGGGQTLQVVGTIVDDDGAEVSVSFGSANYEVAEGESVDVAVILNRDPERIVTIPLIRTHHGGATEGDYSGVPTSVVFGSGVTSRVFEFTALADDDDDDGEAIVLRFGTLPVGVSWAGDTTLAILDDDVGGGGGTGGGTGGGGGSPPPPDPDPPPPPPPTVSLEAAEALESAGAVVFDVRLSASSGAAVTVDYATADGAGAGGAEAGSDYTATQGTLTFPAGSSTRQIRVLVTDDAADEGGAETFTLTLRSPRNASLAGGGSVLRVTGTIRDDDSGPPVAAFAVTGASCAADLCRTVTGEAVGFVDTSAGTVRSRRWEFGDGKTSRSRRPEYAWSSPGFYEVTLRVSDGVTESVASRKFLVEASDPAGSCVADEETLCLQDSRYAVTVAWWTGAGESGAGSVVHAGTNDSGLFTFFSRENWEVLIKVLDGCALNGHVWVYGASTTDLGYTIRVADTVTGTVKEYRNEPGLPAPAITDATAFDACAR